MAKVDEARAREQIEAHVERVLEGTGLSPAVTIEVRADFIAHIEAEFAAQLRRGRTPEEALNAALIRFGDPEAVRVLLAEFADSRRTGERFRPTGRAVSLRKQDFAVVYTWFGSWLGDLRYGLRMLVRAPGVTTLAILTLALGIGANTAVFTLIDTMLLEPLPYSDASSLVSVWPEKVLNEQMLEEVRERVRSVTGIAAHRGTVLTLDGGDGGRDRLVSAMVVSANHLSVLGSTPALGGAFSERNERLGAEDVVILDHDLWQRAFGGNPDIVGELVDLAGEGFARRRVIGVMGPDHQPLIGGTEAWIPLPMDPDSQAFLGGYGLSAIGRLASGVDPGPAAAEVGGLVAEFAERHPTQFRPSRRSPVDVVPLHDVLARDARSTLSLLLAAVGLVLMIACANVANLSLARATARRTELAVRVALGAGRVRLLRQLMTESLLLGLAGGLCGLGLGLIGLRSLERSLQRFLPRLHDLDLDFEVLAFTVLVSVVATLGFGVVPAVRATRRDPRPALGDGRARSPDRRSRRWQEMLVTGEVALAVLVVVGAALMLASFRRLHAVDPGLSVGELATMRILLPPGRYDETEVRERYFTEVLERVEANPAVDSAAVISRLPLTAGNSGIPYVAEGDQTSATAGSVVANWRFVSPGYFDTVGMRLLHGRDLAPTDGPDGETVVVVNESLARRHWGDEVPVGKRIYSSLDGSLLFTIVGVVSDVRQQSLELSPRPEFYLAARQWDWDVSWVVARTELTPATVLPDMRAAASVDVEASIVDLRPMGHVVDASLSDTWFITRLFTGFALLALVLGVVGVYGVVSHTTAQRKRELGLRLALGATPRDLLYLVVFGALRPVMIGSILGTSASLATGRLLASRLYEVSPTDPVVIAAVLGLIGCVGVAASLIPALRAASVPPVEVMRTG